MKTIKENVTKKLGNWLEDNHSNEDMVSAIIRFTKEDVLGLMKLLEEPSNTLNWFQKWEELIKRIKG